MAYHSGAGHNHKRPLGESTHENGLMTKLPKVAGPGAGGTGAKQQGGPISNVKRVMNNPPLDMNTNNSAININNSHGNSNGNGSSSSKGTSSDSSNEVKKRRNYPWDEIAEPSRNNAFAKKQMMAKQVKNNTKSTTFDHGEKNALQNLKPPKKHILSDEQQRILKVVLEERKNVFFTGSAGTGKSVLLRAIIEDLKKKYKNRAEAVAITASTGLAAINIGGTTIHSFAGFGLGEGTVDFLVKKVKSNRKAAARWMRTEALVVDEVSMLDGDMFDKLNKIAQQVRNKPKSPFGGIQIILTGDFFQLPPVNKKSSVKFAFEAQTWNQVLDHTFNLKKVFRQSDQSFIDMLNQMRYGTLSRESIAQFRKLSRVPAYGDGLEPTELFPMRHEVENANQGRLNSLKSDSYKYVAQDSGNEKALEHIMAPATLTLKIGAQVMLIKNREDGLVNGSIGTVVGFGADDLDSDRGGGDFDFIDDDPEFSYKPPKKDKDKETSKKDEKENSISPPPVVEFVTPNGKTRTIVVPMEFKVEENTKTVARRTMIPLILAWSMSIHKSQGQTLERVKVDLRKIFEKGQAYVALSRCTSLEGLQILGFDPNKVMAHPRVVNWYKTLE